MLSKINSCMLSVKFPSESPSFTLSTNVLNSFLLFNALLIILKNLFDVLKCFACVSAIVSEIFSIVFCSVSAPILP